MRRVIIIGLLALTFLSMPLALEMVIEQEPFNPISFGIEILELVTFAATIGAVALLIFEVRDSRRDRDDMWQRLNETHPENKHWREASRDQIDGYRNAVHDQFKIWRLSTAETDIANLMLKGCAHKQIAEIRQSNVATVRQQAQSVYRKSGLQNRAELAAYFLDAVLDPPAKDDVQAAKIVDMT